LSRLKKVTHKLDLVAELIDHGRDYEIDLCGIKVFTVRWNKGCPIIR
jgi:hypothetical protein